jgi:hypothetical protein
VYDGEIDNDSVRIAELWVSGPLNPMAIRVAETKVKRRELTREIVLSAVIPQVLLIVLASILVWVGVVRGLSSRTAWRDAPLLPTCRCMKLVVDFLNYGEALLFAKKGCVP